MENNKYKSYPSLDLPEVNKRVLSFWEANQVFEKSVETRDAEKTFVFYEGPPSANGVPGIHHVMARAVKDIFCRYKTLKGFRVERRAGWDTHGLPVELEVEKRLGIRKDDIGVKISLEDYNKECRKAIMQYTDVWNELTRKMGYWVDMDAPYITYDRNYMETVWHLLQAFYKKGLLYKGYTIQPFSPAAGTGLSTHELNQPGTYRDVKDRSAVVQFKLKKAFADVEEVFVLAWTTTPWTLPSNTALAVGKNIDYVLVETFNAYSHKKICVLLAEERVAAYFQEKGKDADFEAYKPGDKIIPYRIIERYKGSDLAGLYYEQLLPFVQPENGDAFRIITGDFVTTTDGTGIVHIAPSFGADDFRVAAQNGIGSLTLVDKRGRFLPEVQDGVFLYGEEFVKEAYLSDSEKENEYARQKNILENAGKIKELKSYLSVDERIVLKLQEENKLFKKESYEHSYPHCWRTDKPILYYPLDSWFIRTTAFKDKLIEKNKSIQWKPESTGSGRFGNWLENLVDWNLSRSRFWGVPLPIWRTEDASEELCIGSVEELKSEVDKAVKAGFMSSNPVDDEFDLHRPYVDDLILVSASGKPMKRELDLIDVWFDSGAMPYAQNHYMGGEKPKNFPADFIAEGVDQTRGWFFTLHAIAVGLFDSVAFKNVVSNGLVLDKNGNKMSKRLGNAVDPFEMGEKYGFDAVRWYMISNAAPWDNLKFDSDGIQEEVRKFFGTLHNTYSFFALYANLDNFTYAEAEVEDRPEMDRWILSLLNSLVKQVEQQFELYEPHIACRLISQFVNDDLSNWYVRLCRRRFWKGEYESDKISAYQTLYTCLETISRLMSPVAPFYSEQLFADLNRVSGKRAEISVHLSSFPEVNEKIIDPVLEEKMQYAQRISSLILSLRKREKIRVRQPLQKVIIPVLNEEMKRHISDVKDIILAEVNVKEIEFVTEENSNIVKRAKADFKMLGPKFGKDMKAVAAWVSGLDQSQIRELEQKGELTNGNWIISKTDVEILTEDIPGQIIAGDGKVMVALDITLSESLIQEGYARDLVNRIQNIRKESKLELTDKIRVLIEEREELKGTLDGFKAYIERETLAESIEWTTEVFEDHQIVELGEDLKVGVKINKI